MCYSDYNDSLVFYPVYQRVPKTSKQTLSYVCLYFN